MSEGKGGERVIQHRKNEKQRERESKKQKEREKRQKYEAREIKKEQERNRVTKESWSRLLQAFTLSPLFSTPCYAMLYMAMLALYSFLFSLSFYLFLCVSISMSFYLFFPPFLSLLSLVSFNVFLSAFLSLVGALSPCIFFSLSSFPFYLFLFFCTFFLSTLHANLKNYNSSAVKMLQLV